MMPTDPNCAFVRLCKEGPSCLDPKARIESVTAIAPIASAHLVDDFG